MGGTIQPFYGQYRLYPRPVVAILTGHQDETKLHVEFNGLCTGSRCHDKCSFVWRSFEIAAIIVHLIATDEMARQTTRAALDQRRRREYGSSDHVTPRRLGHLRRQRRLMHALAGCCTIRQPNSLSNARAERAFYTVLSYFPHVSHAQRSRIRVFCIRQSSNRRRFEQLHPLSKLLLGCDMNARLYESALES